jgi:hypothetical protein
VLACVAIAAAIIPGFLADYLVESAHPLKMHFIVQAVDISIAAAIFAYVKRESRKAFYAALDEGFLFSLCADRLGRSYFPGVRAAIPENCPRAWLVQLYAESNPRLFAQHAYFAAQAR